MIGGDPQLYHHRSGTWLSTEYSRNYAYALRLQQTESASTPGLVSYSSATTDSYYKTERAAVRCKKNLDMY
jgi:hypothetical protein